MPIIIFLRSVALATSVAPSGVDGGRAAIGQKPLLMPERPFVEPDPEPVTATRRWSTTIRCTVETTETRTRYVAGGRTLVPDAVQTWYAGQKLTGCDRTACASCRFWYLCLEPYLPW